MVRHETCPRCGSIVPSLVRTSGLCRKCNYRLLAEEQREESRRIKDELRRDAGHEQEKREYDAARRDRQRARRR
jgi:DNA-directed RNA polymerase subunit RPC12/RpoP